MGHHLISEYDLSCLLLIAPKESFGPVACFGARSITVSSGESGFVQNSNLSKMIDIMLKISFKVSFQARV